MQFGTDFYQEVVSPNMAENKVPCHLTAISSLPRGEVRSVYVDTSVLLALLKRESCEHTRYCENVAHAFDKLVEEKRNVFISELSERQARSSVVFRGWEDGNGSHDSLQRYFDSCVDGLRSYKRMKFGFRNAKVRKLLEAFSRTEVGILLREKMEDYLHAYIARGCGDVTIMTYDPAFLQIINGRLEITEDGEKIFWQYKAGTEPKPLNVVSPESFLGVDVPSYSEKHFNTKPQPRSCETPPPELRTI